MAKFYGRIWYAERKLTDLDVYSEELTERWYSGDVARNTRRYEVGEDINDNLNVGNTISILADPFAYQNFHKMRAIEWMGTAWKINTVEVHRPRLILQIGGVYNGISGEACATECDTAFAGS